MYWQAGFRLSTAAKPQTPYIHLGKSVSPASKTVALSLGVELPSLTVIILPPHTHLALASLSHDFTVFTDAVLCTSPELGLIMLAVITASQPPRLQDLCAPSPRSGDC